MKPKISSLYYGVSYFKRDARWLCQCDHKHLGLFDTEIDAAQAYNAFVTQNKLDKELNEIVPQPKVRRILW